MSHISIIVLNWNQWAHTIRCLATVFQSTYENYNVILVENGSTDDSLLQIKNWIDGRIPAGTIIYKENFNAKPKKVFNLKDTEITSPQQESLHPEKSLTIIEVPQNIGFARACNFGINYAFKDKTVKYVLTLNNDMEVDPDCVAFLVSVAEENPTVGACQAKVLLSQSPGFIDGIGVSVKWYGAALTVGHGKKDSNEYASNIKIFGAYPATTLFRREMLNQVGLFDEDFFVYYEDVDHCLRVRRTKWIILLVPTAVTHHFHSASYGNISPTKLYYLFRNLIFYAVKNLSVPTLILLLLFYYPLTIFVFIVKTRGDPKALKSIFRGVKDGLLKIPYFLRKRKELQRTS